VELSSEDEHRKSIIVADLNKYLDKELEAFKAGAKATLPSMAEISKNDDEDAAGSEEDSGGAGR